MNIIKEMLFLVSPFKSLIKVEGGVSYNRVNYNKTSKRCIILGNGPSLKDDRQEIIDKSKGADVACVNSFPNYELFNIIKPSYLFLMDTAFWRKDAKKTDINSREKIFNNLNSIDWDMQVIVASNSDLDFFEKKIKNERIEIVKIKSASLEYILEENAFKYYDTGYFCPPLRNVLIFGMFCLLKAGYEEINIYGADMSYLSTINIDQTTNTLFTDYEHFYGKHGKERWDVDRSVKTKIGTLSDYLYIQFLIYKAHELMNDYALLNNTRIKNKSSYSTIDAYSRS